jgi:hypothetical protein
MLKIQTEPAISLKATTHPGSTIAPVLCAPIWRVVSAELIDRLIPLPFIAFLIPQWLIVVIVWHLLCDCSPNRRSLGKWLFRLRVINPASLVPCPVWQAAVQRLGITLTQAAWCLWWGIPWVLLYEFASLVFVLLSRSGRRPDEYLAGTQIVTEKIYQSRIRK